ncbi:unnamed protein product [Gongylonema pulchrum]|uniref:Uncharacterized protein n=1 Tax=Gongylonema pulchrum TaxID=637853 RepID=A0A183EF21_9BILA|nr:unnamed protein product [Gongylonema pulchrum]VDN44303.1 unnamed protein product [Gongylonema pulchrum]
MGASPRAAPRSDHSERLHESPLRQEAGHWSESYHGSA